MTRSFFDKPHRPIWFSMLIIIVLSMIGMNKEFDLQVHDTYYVIGILQMGKMFLATLGINGLAYWFTRNVKLVKWMKVVHIVMVISSLVLILTISLTFQALPIRVYVIREILYLSVFILIFITLLSQLLLITNLLISMFRKQENA